MVTPGNPQLQAILYSGTPAAAGEPLRHPGLDRQFYARHGNRRFWTRHPEAARSLLGAVLGAERQGLDPALFHGSILAHGGTGLSPVARDVLLTDAVLSYADALAEGAVPVGARPHSWALHPPPIDVVTAVDRATAAADPAVVVNGLAPQSRAYEAMRRAYIHYHALAYRSSLVAERRRAPLYPRYSRDRSDDGYGDRAAGFAGSDRYGASDSYDYPHYTRYRPYRSDRRGRFADNTGERRVGASHAARRARELAVNLERLRWLPRHMPATRIVVNTAIARLRYYRDDRPVFTTKAVVGEPTKQTPEFRSAVYDVEFNPPWNVPPKILRQEIMPKLRADPGYLARNHMRWMGPDLLQQQAGPYSALGRLKFEISDPYEIYIHDTPDKWLFRLADRMKSHGCIRIQNPQILASQLLHESTADIWHGIAEGRTHAQPLAHPVPVYIVYQTVTVDPAGRIEFHADGYRRDALLWQMLNRSNRLPLAQEPQVAARPG